MALRNVVLVALTRGEMTGYDIAKRFEERLRFVWHASHQQVYRELKKLEDEGLISHRLVTQEDRPDKKLYRLTEAGERELRAWLEADNADSPVRIKNPLLAKFFAGEYMDIGALRSQLRTARARYEGRLRALREIETQVRRDVPDPSAGQTLAFLALQRGIMDAESWLTWTEQADAALAPFDKPNR